MMLMLVMLTEVMLKVSVLMLIMVLMLIVMLMVVVVLMVAVLLLLLVVIIGTAVIVVLMDSSQPNRQITELAETWPTSTKAGSGMISAEPIKH